MYNLSNFETLIFDCDGVVLNSNKVKTDAFYQATIPYGNAAASEFVEYHVSNGGVSRYKKFSYFLNCIAPRFVSNNQLINYNTLIDTYAGLLHEGLLTCEISPGLEMLRSKTSHTRWLIVSGGDQSEIRDVFARRGIEKYFDGGIFGSPYSKDEILAQQFADGNIRKPALFIGDSKYDYEAAFIAGLDFLFLSGWSECKDWKDWVSLLDIPELDNLNELIS